MCLLQATRNTRKHTGHNRSRPHDHGPMQMEFRPLKYRFHIRVPRSNPHPIRNPKNTC